MGAVAEDVRSVITGEKLRWKTFWLYARPESAERITDIDVKSLPLHGPRTKFPPYHLARLMVIAHLLRTGLEKGRAILAGDEVARHVLWYAVMKGYGSILVTGRNMWIKEMMVLLKLRPELIEEAIGGKPKKDHPNSIPAVHRFALRRNSMDLGSGLNLTFVDSIDKELGKLRPFNASVDVIDLWHMGERLSELCGPLIEFAEPRCPAEHRMFATMDAKKMTKSELVEDEMAIYSRPDPSEPLISPSYNEVWQDVA